MARPAVILGALHAALLGCRPAPEPGPPERTPPSGEPALVFPDGPPRNLLVISMDTTRRDHLDRWARDGVERTPFLASLFLQGVTLDDHLQCSNWTFASTACTQRGRLMEETGFYPRLEASNRSPLPFGQRTLATRLGREGWSTALVSSNDWLSPTWNNAEGFDRFVESSSGSTGVLIDLGLEVLRGWRDEGVDRWFLHVHLMEPHAPYTPPPQHAPELQALAPVPWDLDSQRGQYEATRQWGDLSEEERDLLELHLRTRYAGELRSMDDQLRDRWEALRSEGFLDHALVAIWNDHGEQFWERGHQSHAYNLGAEENDAFLAFLGPGLEPAAWSGPTHAVDLVPTALEALGLSPGDDPDLPGYLLGTAPEDRPRFAATAARLGAQVSVVERGDKLVFDLGSGTVRRWDRDADPEERTDLFDPEDPRTRELWALLRPRAELLAPLVPDSGITWPEGLDAP